MPNKIQDLRTVDKDSFPYGFEQNAAVTLKSSDGRVHVNVYRLKTDEKVPVLVIYGPYGKDIPYAEEAANWGPDTIEGDLSGEERETNRQDQTTDKEKNRFRDEDYYASEEVDPADIKIPLLSVASWGGILLHLRGNVEGYLNAGSDLKYLRFITGRHDLPFYYEGEFALQMSFLDAFLKDDHRVGWALKGKLPPIDLVLRKGDIGFNNAQGEKAYPRRTENERRIARTQYTRFYLSPDQTLTTAAPKSQEASKLSYEALGTSEKPQALQFTMSPFTSETEVTGHITAHLSISCSATEGSTPPSNIHIFLTLRHICPRGPKSSTPALPPIQSR